jgi:2,3-bisphosphoglycerate-independent phosphoglycerate mutase
VPFVLAGVGVGRQAFSSYSETEAANSSLYFSSGMDLMKYFLGK